MDKHLTIPTFSSRAVLGLLILLMAELTIYGVMLAVPALWLTLMFAGFYLGYLALFRHDSLPMVFGILFLTAHHSLLFYYNRELPIAVLFILIFIVNSGIMWLLLHYGTHLKREYHTAYSLISGFMIAQIITLFASMARDWPFRFEVASYMATVFSYIFWRFACLSAEAALSWRQFIRVAALVVILIAIIIIGSPNVSV